VLSSSSTKAGPPGLPPLSTPYPAEASGNSWVDTPGLTPSSGSGSDDQRSDIIGGTPPASEAPDIFVAGDKLKDDLAGLSVHSSSYGDEEDEFMMPGAPVEIVDDVQPEEPVENLWADYEQTVPQEKPGEIVCPAHGKLCARGICKEYNRLKKQMEREKEAAEAAAAALDKKKSKKSKGKAPVIRECFLRRDFSI
jgi:hypothetical protein